MRLTGAFAVAAIVWLAGCNGEDQSRCDPSLTYEIAPVGVWAEAFAPDAIDRCADNGCVSVQTARCIARAAGLEEGLEGLQVVLEDDPDAHPYWYVRNVTARPDEWSWVGEFVTIDAFDGSIVDRGNWREAA